MKGSNELRFNVATMEEIVQFWLNNKWLNKNEPGPQVTLVEQQADGMFRVAIEQEQKAA